MAQVTVSTLLLVCTGLFIRSLANAHNIDPGFELRNGVISYDVARRTREVGIRIALGARRADVLRMVIGEGVRLVVIGVVLGLGLALMVTRLLTSLLFGISPTDPATFVGIAMLLAGVAALAAYAPARRASSMDPMVALRQE